MNTSHLLTIAAESGGVLFAMPLLLLAALTVIFDRFLTLARTQSAGDQVLSAVERMQHIDIQQLRQHAIRIGDPFRSILEVPLRYPQIRSDDKLNEVLQEAIMRQLPKLDRRLWVLDTIVTLAPLLGLLGTIIGMFNAFKVLGNLGSAPTAVTGGVAEALVATAAGLVIAIIGLLAYNGLHNRVRLVLHQMETLKIMLVNRLDGLEHSVEFRSRVS